MYHFDQDTTLDEMEEVALFVQEALAADPDSAPLAAETADWLPRIDAQRSLEREARRAKVKAGAQRQVSLVHVDGGIGDFGRALLVAVHGDRTSARFRLFLPESVSALLRRAAPRQAETVRRWLAIPEKDAAFEPHRAFFTTWVGKLEGAFVLQADAANARGRALVGKESLTDEMNRDLDGLHGHLLTVQADKQKPAGWADAMFPVQSRRRKKAEPDDAPAPAPAAPKPAG